MHADATDARHRNRMLRSAAAPDNRVRARGGANYDHESENAAEASLLQAESTITLAICFLLRCNRTRAPRYKNIKFGHLSRKERGQLSLEHNAPIRACPEEVRPAPGGRES